jgi:hypothetical protein
MCLKKKHLHQNEIRDKGISPTLLELAGPDFEVEQRKTRLCEFFTIVMIVIVKRVPPSSMLQP